MRASKGGEFFQFCWVVKDLHAAMRQWHETTGTGPFFYVERPAVENYRYRGRSSPAPAFSAAWANSGHSQIELLQQHDDFPSAYTDSLGLGGAGFHHVGTVPKDYDAELARYESQGVEVAHSATFVGQRYCYVDTRATVGWMIELMDINPETKDFYQLIEATAATWDGSDPYRKIG